MADSIQLTCMANDNCVLDVTQLANYLNLEITEHVPANRADDAFDAWLEINLDEENQRKLYDFLAQKFGG